MKYIDEFRNKNLIQKIAEEIKAIMPDENINIMEVCGTHTQSFFRFGLDKLLPGNLRLIAGPGCPVCVSSSGYIDCAIQFAQDKDTIMVTFGDMLRIPGSTSSLEETRARFGNVRVVYSALDSLHIAKLHPDKKVIFLAVGFETTAPTVAASILTAKKENLKNLFFFSSLKLIPPAMDFLVKDKRLNIQGFLCPGHVSAIIGTRPYEFIPRKYRAGCCIAGFEPLDILEGLYILIKQIRNKKPQVENQYIRVVARNGNPKAKKINAQVFKVSPASWRGLGEIPQSGLKMRDEYSLFDAEKVFCIKRTTNGSTSSPSLELSRAKSMVRLRSPSTLSNVEVSRDHAMPAGRQEPRTTRCKCGDVLKGLISPIDCPLFSKVCRPDNPVGPCMVTNEGTCNAYYKYR